MNTKMGRPPLPKGQSKQIQVGVRFNPGDDKKIEKAVKDSGQTKADWVRNAAIAESKKPPIWVKSKWTHDDLEGALVEFRLTAPKFQVEGVGKFMVRVNPRDELAVEICVARNVSPCEIAETRYYLSQEAMDKIEAHPNPKLAQFRLWA